MESFVNSLLERLLATSVQTALLAAAVWLLCRFVPRLSPATQCWLWWLVALQVVVGLCVDPVQLPWLPQAQMAAPVVASAAEPLPFDGVMAMSVAVERGPSWQTMVFALWLGGCAVMGWSTLRGWQRGRKLLQSSAPCTDQRLLQAVAQAAGARGLRGTPRLRMSAHIDSPLVLGPLRPVLLLPVDAPLSSAELEMAVAHELEHLRRADLWWGFVPVLARHCFFFHPLLHVAVREYDTAREAACDAAVVDAGHRSRHDYGEMLLRLGAAQGSGSGLAAASPTFRALSRRLVLLQHTAFLPRAGSIAVLVLVLAGVMPLRLVGAAASPLVMPDADGFYPATPRPAGEEGEAMRLCFDENGNATESSVSGGLKTLRLKPGTIDGKPWVGCATAPIKFTIGQAFPAQQGNPPAPKSAAPALVRVAAPPSRIVVEPGPSTGKEAPPPPAGASVKRSESVLTPPGFVFKPDLQDFYPPASRAAGEEGVVKVRVCYDDGGKVTEATVPESSGFPRLDEAAGRYGSLVRMKPGTTDGVPQAGCVVMPVRFSLGAEIADAPATQYTGERMNVNFQDIPVRTLLQLIGDTSGRNILVDDAVSGRITLRVNNVPWDQLLDMVLRTKGLEKQVQGDVIRIAATAMSGVE